MVGLSAHNVVRLKQVWEQEFQAWSKRDLHGKRYVYLWADADRAPRGAREPGGMQGPTNGLSQQPVEAGGSLTLGAQGKVEAASTTTEWSGTSRHSTSGKQDGMV